jgi:anti-sigma B factor antagonist
MLLTVDSSSLDGHAVITAAGEIDLATVSLLSTAMADSISAGTTVLTINLGAVSYIDSAGLGALVGAYKRLAATGGELTIRCSHPRLVRLFEITGLTRLLTVVVDAVEPASAGERLSVAR